MNKRALSADSLLMADWPVPDHIIAFSTCRDGGVSPAPYDSLNLGEHVGDEPEAVRHNRQLLIDQCQGLSSIQWLNQVHGVHAVSAGEQLLPDADASFTTQTGLGCAVMTADCLPILLCDSAGQQIAAVHAGWRGLVAGVIEQAVAGFASNSDVLAWLGPAISQQHFEVGDEVRQAFLKAATGVDRDNTAMAFQENTGRPGFYFADLYQLARLRLHAIGITQIYGGDCCTYADQSRFYSYRRNGVCGRMATLIYKKLS